ncbi:Gfo/Idh/MocA family oxidoreductase [Planctomycetales bacterium ZRK34]|nr:Gfo/Idh/MocA family oxidoreductase [Planctomycetales bacterium ZRK34]
MSNTPTRRQVLATAAVTAAAAKFAPSTYAASDETIRLALVGCGGRGSGAAGNALTVSNGPIKLHAMADLFDNRLKISHKSLSKRFGEQIDVPDDRKYVGLDAYKAAIDTLRPGDVVLLTAYSYCRAQHMEYAVNRGINVFMEKPFVPDPGTGQRMLKIGELADKKNVKVAAGLMCRHSVARQALIEKIRNGEVGDVLNVRAYRMWAGGALGARPKTENELLWQLRHRTGFFWAGSGDMIEMLIHQIDECCWIKDAWPVSCHGIGGRVPHSTDHGQCLDIYAMEYTFPDGTTATVDSRSIRGARYDFATYLHGTKCAAQFSGNVHAPTVRIFKNQHIDQPTADNIAWAAPPEPSSPYDAEWRELLTAIRADRPYNETRRAVYADFAAIMGRAACHINNTVTWDQVAKSNYKFCADVDSLTVDSPAPVHDDEQGFYPVPIPGKWSEL